MVLTFTNNLVLIGGSKELREQCLESLEPYGSISYSNEITDIPSNETRVVIVSDYAHLDNALVSIAMNYLALDFRVEFKPKSDIILKDWEGCLRVVDQQVYFSDNYEATEGYSLGSVYEVDLKGGFPGCLKEFQNL